MSESSAKKKSVRLSEDSMELIQEVAVEYDMTLAASADKLIKTGFSRLQALNKYAAKGRKA